MSIVEIILLALSLSVDSLVVSMCGSVTLGRIRPWKVCYVAFVFALMQFLLFFIGWALGHSVVDYISEVAGVVGFVLLLYIGLSMIIPALRKKGGDGHEHADLSGLKHVLLSAIATSVDASAVGVSLAMTEMSVVELIEALVAVFVVTFVAASAGVAGGASIGHRFGRPARIVGGAVLLFIGLKILLQ